MSRRKPDQPSSNQEMTLWQATAYRQILENIVLL